MASSAAAPGTSTGDDPRDSRISSVPLLGEGFTESHVKPTPETAGSDLEQEYVNSPGSDSKTGKRRFWGLGKKKDDGRVKGKREQEQAVAGQPDLYAASASGMQSGLPLGSPNRTTIASPAVTSHPYGTPTSPERKMSNSSPHIPSPASSQIFERNVQEDGLATSASPAIPSHITTENHIPPVLDASSVALTDDHLNPDNVEIVMHSAHQPAAVSINASSMSEPAASISQDESVSHLESDETASNYGALDAADVRRLSFISFADVVHAEHTADHVSGRESVLPSAAASVAAFGAGHRSPSPVRSPLSTHAYSSSPPKGLETSPHRAGRNLASPIPGHSPPTGGELTIETMRQALRKTGSGDLSGARSQPLSAVGGEDGSIEQPLK
ncbi:MAG: hypothetical protein Q9177_001043 [Variospora cf. flavescens]